MKAIFFVLASACLIGALSASSIDFPSLTEDNFFQESEESYNIFEENADKIIVPFPTDDPFSTPEYPSSTTTEQSSSTTPEQLSTITSTSSRPNPPSTSSPQPPRPQPTSSPRPRPPTTSRPEPPRPQPPSSPRPRPPTTSRPEPPRPQPPRPQPPRPLPPPPRPPVVIRPDLNRAQIYNNAYRSLGPFASRLVNVVQNRAGYQKTVQRNDIIYNLRLMKPTQKTYVPNF